MQNPGAETVMRNQQQYQRERTAYGPWTRKHGTA